MQICPSKCRKQFDTEGLPQIIGLKVKRLVNLLNSSKIKIKELRKILSQGIPDQAPILRQYCWKIILGYLPLHKSEWETTIEKYQASYNEFIKLFIPPEKLPDYPYMMDQNHERWSELNTDFLLWQQIEKDTSRTYAQLTFFSTPAPQIMIPFFTSSRKQKFKLINGEDKTKFGDFLSNKQLQKKTYRYDYMTRILFIYAKLNPKVEYVQGMNEILAPIFYLVNAGKSFESPLEQASCFFMFNNAIADIIELHIQDLDKSQHGIHGTLSSINDMLFQLQPNVWERLDQLNIDPLFYCFRWVTLLFAQDFQLFQILRIWESIFSEENRMKFMSFFAISMIISAKQFILNNKDFTKILTYLQNIGEKIDVDQTIYNAKKLNEELKNYNFKQNSELKKQELKQAKRQEKLKKKEQQAKNQENGKIQGKWSSFIRIMLR